ncbi:MAG TPA: hypothetical protein VII72_20195 [Myxococcota bacterium]
MAAESVLTVGDRLHVATRRLFASDVHDHFFGEVTAVSDVNFRIVGRAFVYDPTTNTYVNHPDIRTRLFSLADTARDFMVLPRKVDVDKVRYEITEGRLLLVDGKGFELEIAEFRVEG